MKDRLKFVCFICNQIAKSLKKLDKHIRESHKGVKILSCLCGKTFDKKRNYNEHVNSQHFVTKIFSCEKGCSKEFLTNSSRLHHYRIVHKDSYVKLQKQEAVPKWT